MKYFENFLFIWLLSVLLLMFKSAGAAVLNIDNNNTVSVENSTYTNSRILKNNIYNPCQTGISMKCIKMELAQYIDQLSEKNEIQLLPGLEIVKDNNVAEKSPTELATEMAQKYPNDPSRRLNEYILSKLTNYMQSHNLRLKLIDDKAITEARSISESARKKKGGGMEAIMAAGIAMKGTLMALALGALALLAGKALTASLMALMMAAAVGLKGMDGGKHVQYEIISKPIHTSSHKHHDDHQSHSGYTTYGRSFQLEKPID